MDAAISIGWAVLSVAGLVSLVFTWAQIALDPIEAWRDMHLRSDATTRDKVWAYGHLALQAGALAVVFYRGLERLFGWVPGSWGGVTDDGTYITGAGAIAGTLTVLCLAAAFSGMAALAEARSILEEQRRARKK